MRQLDGVQTYVDGKRVGGATYAKGIKSLSSFCRYAGGVELSSIRERQVASFLDGPHISPVTWRQKYNLLRHFFQFWVARNAMDALPMPSPRPTVVTTFVPYTKSRSEIRLLLSTVRSCQEKSFCKIDARTLRTFLLFLYGTEPWSVRLAGFFVRTSISNEEQ